MKLQSGIEKSDHIFDFYVQCIDYIRSYLQQEESLTDVRGPVLQLLNKWCGSSNVVIQAFKKHGPLYDKLIGMVSDNSQDPVSQSDDHPYTANLNNSFDVYLKAKQGNCPVDQLVTSVLADIPVSNSDLERLFSYAKFLKTSIQSRMDAENFSRNVFLKMTEELNTDGRINTALTPVVLDN